MQATHQAPAITNEIVQTQSEQAAALELSMAQLMLVGGGNVGVALF